VPRRDVMKIARSQSYLIRGPPNFYHSLVVVLDFGGTLDWNLIQGSFFSSDLTVKDVHPQKLG
jgi:hypothetical protein